MYDTLLTLLVQVLNRKLYEDICDLIIGYVTYDVKRWNVDVTTFLNRYSIKHVNQPLSLEEEELVIQRILLTRRNAKIDARYITHFSPRLRYAIIRYVTNFTYTLPIYIVDTELRNHGTGLLMELIMEGCLSDEYIRAILYKAIFHNKVEVVTCLLLSIDLKWCTYAMQEAVRWGKEVIGLWILTNTQPIPSHLFQDLFLSLFPNLCKQKMWTLIDVMVDRFSVEGVHVNTELCAAQPLILAAYYRPSLVPRLIQLGLFHVDVNLLTYYGHLFPVDVFSQYVSTIQWTSNERNFAYTLFIQRNQTQYAACLKQKYITCVVA